MSDADDLLGFMYACPFGLIELDAVGNIGLINPHAMNHLLSLAGAHGVENFFSAVEDHAPELRNFTESFTAPDGAICEGHRIVVDLGQCHQEGRPKVLSCSLIKRAPNQLIATLSDISVQVEQESRLSQADMWFSSLIDEINDHALLTVDSGGLVVSANASLARQTGYDADAIMGQPIETILCDAASDIRTRLSIADQLALAARNGWHLFEGWERRADGERYWCQRLAVARAERENDASRAFSLVFRDVPKRGENATDLIELLTTDYLTGATNRMQFQKILRREHDRHSMHGRPLALIILDLDNFKTLNDTYGHPAGDTMLKAVARTGLDHAPETAVFARLGGEEFALLMPDCSIDQVIEHAEALRRQIADQMIDIPGGRISVTVSLGCAEISESDGSIDGLIALADRRLYDAKRGGRDRVGAGLS